MAKLKNGGKFLVSVNSIGDGLFQDAKGNQYTHEEVEWTGSGYQLASEDTIKSRDSQKLNEPQTLEPAHAPVKAKAEKPAK